MPTDDNCPRAQVHFGNRIKKWTRRREFAPVVTASKNLEQMDQSLEDPGPLGSFDTGQLTKTVLVSIYKDNTETCKKIFHISDAPQLLTFCYSEFSHPVQLERFLKYNKDFNDYIDCDITTAVQDYDKFQVYVATEIHLQIINVQPTQTKSTQAEDSLPLQSFLSRKAPDTIAEYEHTGMLSTEGRKKIITVSVGDLVAKHGFYPSTADKLNLAKSLIAIFPSLNLSVCGENEGYEHLYDPVSHKGFIEIKLRNMRRHLEEGQRRYQRKRKVPCSVSAGASVTQSPADEDPIEWLTIIKRMKPSSENISTIKTAMEKTFNHRRNWISTQMPTVDG
ncbi:uncharacterized protein LOC123966794 [Micropterus dolomieu]|uniref:uncharacterized protein LOC123966794 n=1 Tax=Micropterus dolomieu TaxID=147949 RepID=UPI001E8CFBB1|nr:uncharacterized protein LOC123966794 [Micropterus dolomieu]